MERIWPIALVVLANTLYQVCAKAVPADMHPFASLSVTYGVGMAASLLLFFLTQKDGGLVSELGKLNWGPIVLGLVVVALELGFLYVYRAGWAISTAQVVQSAVLAVALLLVGRIFYGEPVTWNKLVGIAAVLLGLVFINLK